MSSAMKLTVREACHEDWNKMTPDEQGKFCSSCQKKVVDFATMTDQEILQYISEKGVKLCGRFDAGQLDRVLHTANRTKTRWAYVWNVAVAGFLSIFQLNANAQPTSNSNKQAQTIKIKETARTTIPGFGGERELTGVIYDEHNNSPIFNAEVRLKGTETVTYTNEKGEFLLKITNDNQSISLAISAIGYFEQEFTVNNQSGKLSLYLQSVPVILPIGRDSLERISFPVMGTIMVAPKIKLREKVKREVMDKLPNLIQTKYMKVHPNPVPAGSAFRIDLDKLTAGAYDIQLIDLNGIIFHAENLTINQGSSTVSIYSDEALARGVYWVRMISKSTKKVYTAKLVIQ